MKPTLQIGYAESSTRRYPKEPTLVVVGETEVRESRYVGFSYFGGYRWRAFRHPSGRYYFQTYVG